MSDIDDELLALAGGDVSSGEEDEAMDMSRDASRSPARASSKERDTPARGVAVKKTPAKKTKKHGSRSDDESEDEGEA